MHLCLLLLLLLKLGFRGRRCHNTLLSKTWRCRTWGRMMGRRRGPRLWRWIAQRARMTQRRPGFQLRRNIRIRSSGLVVAVHDGSLNGWRLGHSLRHMTWTQGRASSLCPQLGLDVDAFSCQHIFSFHLWREWNTFLEEYSFEQRVLISEHEAFVCGTSMSCL